MAQSQARFDPGCMLQAEKHDGSPWDGNLEAGVPSATDLGNCIAVVPDGHWNQRSGLLPATAGWWGRLFWGGGKGGAYCICCDWCRTGGQNSRAKNTAAHVD